MEPPLSKIPIIQPLLPDKGYDIIKYVFYLIIYSITFTVLFNENLQILGFFVSFIVNFILSILISFDLYKYGNNPTPTINNPTPTIKNDTSKNDKVNKSNIQTEKFKAQLYLFIILSGFIFNIIASLFMVLTMGSIISANSTATGVHIQTDANGKHTVNGIPPFDYSAQSMLDSYKNAFTANSIFIFILIIILLFAQNLKTIFIGITLPEYISNIVNYFINLLLTMKPILSIVILCLSGYLIYISDKLMSLQRTNYLIPVPPTDATENYPIMPLSNKSWNLSMTEFVKKYMNPYYLSNYMPFSNY
jgi:hypothetical protein